MSREDLYDEAQNTLETSMKRLAALRERALRALAALDGKPDAPPQSHPRYVQAVAARDTAQLDLERTRVAAPAAGVVSNLKMRPGEYVERGAPRFSLVESGHAVGRGQLQGDAARRHARRPARAPSRRTPIRTSTGARASATIAPATGAEFAVLPPQNATGNWVKVVQRVPVRIAIEHAAGTARRCAPA